MRFSELINRRACVRAYKNAPITAEQITEILSAGIRAPNACNYQSWHFYAVTDREKIQSANKTVASIQWAADIPLLIVVCIREQVAAHLCKRFGEERGRAFCEHDAAGAVNHMLLRTAELGLGGCWIGPMDIIKCKEHFGIDPEHTPTAILTIGTPASEPCIRERRPLADAVTFVGEPISAENQTQQEEPFKLENASLPCARFENLNLQDAKFNNINLQGATFNDINLSGSKFTDIFMQEAFFGGMNMKHARFGCVELQNSEFKNPDLSETKFINCSLENVSIENCKLSGLRIDGIEVEPLLKKE